MNELQLEVIKAWMGFYTLFVSIQACDSAIQDVSKALEGAYGAAAVMMAVEEASNKSLNEAAAALLMASKRLDRVLTSPDNQSGLDLRLPLLQKWHDMFTPLWASYEMYQAIEASYNAVTATDAQREEYRNKIGAYVVDLVFFEDASKNLHAYFSDLIYQILEMVKK